MSEAERISVMYFSNEAVRGGAEEHILTLLRGLDRDRFRLHLVCAPELAQILKSDLPKDVELLPLSFSSPRCLSGASRLRQLIRERKVDILHSHLFWASLCASPVGWLCRVPVILETPHLSERWRRGWFTSRFFVDRLAGRFVDHYIAVSEANARYLSQEKGLPPRKINVIHNGCDLGRFGAPRRAPADLRDELGFAAGDPILLVAARLEPQKGHSVLLDALPLLQLVYPRVRLVCVGEGSLRADLGKQVASLGIQENVRFVGFQPNIPDWLALADVVVLPSFYEGLPLVAIESLAAGRPVVATAVDGTPEVIVQGRTGLTVQPGDPRQLAKAIQRLLDEPELRREFAHAGRQHVLDKFSQERQVRSTGEFYRQALARKRSASQPRPFLAQADSVKRVQ